MRARLSPGSQKKSHAIEGTRCGEIPFQFSFNNRDVTKWHDTTCVDARWLAFQLVSVRFITVQLLADAVGHGNGPAERTSIRICGQSSQAARSETGDDGGWNVRDVESLLHRLQSRRRFAAALHKERQERRGDHGQHLSVLRVAQHTELPSLSRSHHALWGKARIHIHTLSTGKNVYTFLLINEDPN